MNDRDLMAGEQRLQDYLSQLADVLGHADRKERLVGYCTGLLLPGERKSVEPMAARPDPAQVPSLHQALHHFVAPSPWHDAAVLAAVREQVLPALTRHGPITAWIIDDTGLPKKGKHSVGVARQYCGQLGKQDNCQVAVSLSLAHDGGSLPVAFDLYLPEEWATDPVRRATAGVPKTLAFRTKPQIALEQIRRALAEGLPPGVVLGDAAYGVETDFRTALTAVSLSYVLGVHWRLAAGMRSLAAQAVVGQRAPTQPSAPRCRASAGQRQGPRLDPAAECLADGELARGQPGGPERALRHGAGASVSSRLLAGRAASGGVAADR